MEAKFSNPRYVLWATALSIFLFFSLGIISASEPAEKQDPNKGTAIVAARTGSVGGLGHVGVAFENADGTWTAGAIEGAPEKSWSNLGGLVVLPSGDEGAWSKQFNTREEVETEFQSRDYDKIKEIPVANSNPDGANKEIEKFKDAGYFAPFNDCLTQTDSVLRAYGVNTNMNTFGVVTSLTGPIGAAAQLASDVLPNVYFYSLPGGGGGGGARPPPPVIKKLIQFIEFEIFYELRFHLTQLIHFISGFYFLFFN